MARAVKIRPERRVPFDKQRFLVALLAVARLKLEAADKEKSDKTKTGGGDAS